MTHIKQMIQDMCPQGVEWKKLGEVCEMKRGRALSKADIIPASEDTLPVILYGELYTTYSGHIREIKSAASKERAVLGVEAKKGDLLLPISSTTKESQIGSAADLLVDKPVYIGGDAIVLSHQQNSGYLVYYINSTLFKKEKMACVSGTTVTHLSPSKLMQIEIPIPPLAIQKRIVELLDEFSALAAELQAELQARRKQYEYYRTHLLTPTSESNSADNNDGCKWEWIPLKDLIVSLKTGLNPRKNFVLNTPESNIPYITGKDIYNNQINVSSNTDKIDEKARDLINKRAHLESNLLLFASTGTGTVGRMAIVEEYNNDWAMSETLYAIKTKKSLIPRYLMYCLYSPHCRDQFESKISRGSVPHLKVVDLLNVKIPIPPLAEQERIVVLLDEFDKLTNSLTEGIPAEQAAQQKRYEYFRDLLLTFDRKAE